MAFSLVPAYLDPGSSLALPGTGFKQAEVELSLQYPRQHLHLSIMKCEGLNFGGARERAQF